MTLISVHPGNLNSSVEEFLFPYAQFVINLDRREFLGDLYLRWEEVYHSSRWFSEEISCHLLAVEIHGCSEMIGPLAQRKEDESLVLSQSSGVPFHHFFLHRMVSFIYEVDFGGI